MSRIPQYAYRVVTHVELVRGRRTIEQHNYNNLAGAIAYRDIVLRRPTTKKVEVLVVLDETTRMEVRSG